jgi:hypothetical protein
VVLGDKPITPVLLGLGVRNLCCAITLTVGERSVTFVIFATIFAIASLKKNAGNLKNHPTCVMVVLT